MVQIIDDPNRNPLQALSSNLGAGVQTGIRHLLDSKVADVKHRSMVSELGALGIDPHSASFIARLPHKEQLEALDLYRHKGGSQDAQGAAPDAGMAQQQQQEPSPLLGGKERRERQKAEHEAFKETKSDRQEIISKKNAALSVLSDLNRMEELEKEGKLDSAGYSEFLNRSGLNIPALMEEGSEEFNKIANNFVRGAKEYYGGRISNQEMEQFLKTVPSLSQSPEGRKRVIANLKHINNMAVATYDAYREVLKSNRGIPPLDLLEKVDERLDKKRERLAREFRQDLAKPVPKGQNKFITSLQAGAGSLLGAPGSVLTKIGAILG